MENSLSSCEDQTEEVKELEGIRGFELENAKLKAEIEVLKRQRSLKDSRLFQLRNFTTDEDIAFYTGFPNLATFNAVFEFLNTGRKGENIRNRSLFIACGGAEYLGLKKVKFNWSPLWILLHWSDPL